MQAYNIIFYVTDDTRHAPYTIQGLLKLAEKGIIKLQFEPASYQRDNRVTVSEDGICSRNYRPYPWSPEFLITEIATGKQVKMTVDLQDWDQMFSYHSLKNCDIIFKRAYTSKASLVSKEFNIPILPAGINHSAIINSLEFKDALTKHQSWNKIQYAIYNPREIWRYLKEKIKKKKQSNSISPLPKSENEYLQSPPSTPYVFFQVEFHNWNNRESIKINKTRAEIIRTLRKELGPKFVGGMYFKNGVNPEYADCLTNVPSKREIYLQFVKEATVVICSNGFGDSIPWKLPEYLQIGKCIVAETLAHKVPVAFSMNEILFFDNINQCVEHSNSLLADKERRAIMEKESKEYYEKHILPENSMLRMIKQSFEIVHPINSSI